jgi:predicted dehydrogenase
MKEIDRRYFFLTSGAIVGGAFLRPGTKAQSPNDRIRVAVVGLGGRGGGTIQEYKELSHMNVEVAALCDVDENILDSRLRDLRNSNRIKRFTDLRELLEDKSLDVVSFATPDHWHALGTIWACQAGKDVYVEKPCSHNVWEGRKAVDAARKHNRIVQHGTQIRSSGAVQEAVQKLKEGIIGRVYAATGVCYNFRNTIGRAQEEPVPAGVHYDLWLGPAPAHIFTRNRFHYNWHWFWDYGSGDLGNQGVHQLDVARWGLGVGLPRKVHSTGGHFVFDDDQETPNFQVCTFEYLEERKVLTFEVRNWCTNPVGSMGQGQNDSIGVFFYGSEGYMEIPSYESYQTFMGQKKEPGRSVSEGGNHVANFIQAVRSRKPEMLSADIEQGHLSAALVHLANISYRLGRSLVFDPTSEKFPNDPEANQLLRIEYRSPFVVPESA